MDCPNCHVAMGSNTYEVQPVNYHPTTHVSKRVGNRIVYECDASWNASRVQVFKCPTCQKEEFFFRCNNPFALLQLRRGRCGEFANVFTMLCSSLGYRTRLTVDLSPEKGDHLWTEVYLPDTSTTPAPTLTLTPTSSANSSTSSYSSNDSSSSSSSNSSNSDMSSNSSTLPPSPPRLRFVHFDSCEAKYDKPHLYERGWHKPITCIVSFSTEGCVNVTQRYTQKQYYVDPSLDRSQWVSCILTPLNRRVFASMSASVKAAVVQRMMEDIIDMREENLRRTIERERGEEAERKRKEEEERRRSGE